MSTKSNDQGRAYEYAWIYSLCRALENIRKTEIIKNSSLEANERAWISIDESLQKVFRISADAAVEKVIEMEPMLTEPADDLLTLEFQKDTAGEHGDVRDIVAKRNTAQWEFGLSVKHNHDAVKHSRLSHKLNFGEAWYHQPCSNNYWNEIEPIFDRLKKEKDKGTKWSELEDKDVSVYVPILNAFMNELNRAYEKDENLPCKMIEYLIGLKDYYKVVSHDEQRVTFIHTFNMHGTLNKPSKIKVSAITVPIVNLPTEFVALKFKKNSTNTVEAYFNNGWQLSFRIHNASTIVEPSLKFDIQVIGMPTEVLNIQCQW